MYKNYEIIANECNAQQRNIFSSDTKYRSTFNQIHYLHMKTEID